MSDAGDGSHISTSQLHSRLASTPTSLPATMPPSNSLQDAVTAMTSGDNQFDVTIICTTDDFQADYWMQRLGDGICKNSRMVLACAEDWGPGGAGNGLGTLYAYQKACKLAQSKYGVDLNDLLAKKEVAAALFHTAGKGTRMAPLPASENNNKPGVVSGFVYICPYALCTITQLSICKTSKETPRCVQQSKRWLAHSNDRSRSRH
jgi:hypothetical protein